MSAGIHSVQISDVRSISIEERCLKTHPCKHTGKITLFNGKVIDCVLYTPQWHVLADSLQEGRVLGGLCPNMRPTSQSVQEILDAAFGILPQRYSGNVNSCCSLL